MKSFEKYVNEAQENPEVKAGAVEYVRMANAAFDNDKESKYFKERDTSVVMKKAQKFYKIWIMEFGRLSSIHAFIDIETGDLLKPASTKAPAKGARGNVTDEAFMKKLKGGKFDKYGGHLYLRR